MTIQRLLVANRGEIALRVIKTCQKMGIETIALYTPIEAGCLAALQADMAIALPAGPLSHNYLNSDLIIELGKTYGADAIHPGYGFLSENATFAQACAVANIQFIGPTPESIQVMALKHEAKAFMEKAGVPVLPGFNGESSAPETLQNEADKMGYPLLIKAAAGGGGRGMRVVHQAKEFIPQLKRAKQEALSYFSDDRLLLERYFPAARHIEVQVIGDTYGTVCHFGTRECSLQRRHQKVIEEAPALLPADVISKMCQVSVKACTALGYVGAGTLEFLVTPDNDFYFLEMNTRLQVEHPVTEQVCGQDLVALQIIVAQGDPLPLKQSDIHISGHSIEARVYAEDPVSGFLPSTGRVQDLFFLEDDDQVRIDLGTAAGQVISAHFDPMIAKVITTGNDRPEALSRLSHVLSHSYLVGTKTNLNFLNTLVQDPNIITNQVTTRYLDENADILTCVPPLDNTWCSILLHAWLETAMSHELSTWQLNLSPTLRTQWQVDGEFVFVQFCPSTGAYTCRLGDLVISDLLDTTFADWQKTFSDFCLLSYQGICREVRFKDGIIRDRVSHQEGSLTAPMPGKVCAIYVQSGEKVCAGDKLLILEAMKMEHTITAPADGTVSQLFVKDAEQVTAGQILLELKELNNG